MKPVGRSGFGQAVNILAAGVLAAVAALAAASPTVSGDRETTFRTECAARFEIAEKSGVMAVTGLDGWLFLAKELRHISVGAFWGDNAARVSRADKPQWADPLPAILDFKRQLDKAGIQLLVVPVPPKAVVYPDKLSETLKATAPGAAAARMDPSHQSFYTLLREQGVQVEDLADALIAARGEGPDVRAMYCKTDSHWSPYACEVAARRIRDRFKGAAWLVAGPNPFTAEAGSVSVTGDLAGGGGTEGARETLPVRSIRASGGSPAAGATVDKTSPVLLLGDSHCLVFHSGGDMLATGAGLADQLAYELGMPVDLLGVRGSGATPARVNLMQRARADAGYLSGKKVVIWCFTAREFTESQGWRNVPVVP